MSCKIRLLHIDEEVAFEDVLPFLVLLGLFVRLVLPVPPVLVSREGAETEVGMLTYFQPRMVRHLQQ